MCRTAYIFLLFAIALVAGQNSTVGDCEGVNVIGSVKNISISTCNIAESKDRCILRRGTNVTITIEFDVLKEVSGVTADVHGILKGIPVPFPLDQPEVCTRKVSALDCPLKPGSNYVYTDTFPVRKSYPKVNVDVKWELKNENGEDILCKVIQTKIQ